MKTELNGAFELNPIPPFPQTHHHSKTYRETSRRVQRDVTYGIADGVARLLDISPWELQDPQEFLQDRRAGSPSVRAEEATARAALAGSASLWLAAGVGEDGRRPGPGMVLASSPVGANLVFASIAGAEGTGIYDAADVYTMIPRHMMLTMLFFAGVVCPEDRPAFFYLTLSALFSSGYRTCSRFIKVGG